MKMNTVYLIVQLAFLAVIMVFLVRYVWGILFGKSYYPVAWQDKAGHGEIIPKLIRLEKKYPDKVRFFNFWFQLERIKKEDIPGSLAELGVYKGQTARIIHTMEPSRPFHLFDTFEGFPGKDLAGESGDAATYTTEHFSDTTAEKVRRYIGGNRNVIIHKGYFPESAAGLENETYAFVTMDADLYKPTKEGLAYFYPRLAPGGVIIIHDYDVKWEGIIRALDEFAATIPESIIPVADRDCSVMIIKNKKT